MYSTKIRKKIVSCFAMLCVVIMATILLPEIQTSAKTTEKKIEFTNPVTSLNVGNSYTFKVKVTPIDKNEKITWRTSNPQIATVDQNGKVTAKMTGNVVIAAYTKSGERVGCVISVVTKYGLTDSCYVMNQMLKSTQCHIISLRQLDKKWYYVIKEGDYSYQALNVNIPKSHLDNHGVFKRITINAIGEDTYFEYAIGNTIYVNDPDADIEVTKDASVKLLQTCNSGMSLELGITGEVKKLEVLGKKTYVHIYGTGNLDSMVIPKTAKNSNITLEIPTTVSMSCDGKITIQPGAEGTIVEAVEGSKNIEIVNLAKGSVWLKNMKTGEEKRIIGTAGEREELTGKVSKDGKEVLYTLPVRLSSLESIEISIRNKPFIKLDTNVLTFMNHVLDVEEQYMMIWRNISDFNIVKDGMKIQISGKAGSWTKQVSLAGMVYDVTVDKTSKTVSVKHTIAGNVYIFSKIGDSKLKISSPTNSNVGEMLSLLVKYL